MAAGAAFTAEKNKRVRRGGTSEVWNPALDTALEAAYVRTAGDRAGTLREMRRMYPDHAMTANRVNHRLQRLGVPGRHRRVSEPKLVAVGVTLSPHIVATLKKQVGGRGYRTFASLAGAVLTAVASEDLFDALLGTQAEYEARN